MRFVHKRCAKDGQNIEIHPNRPPYLGVVVYIIHFAAVEDALAPLLHKWATQPYSHLNKRGAFLESLIYEPASFTRLDW